MHLFSQSFAAHDPQKEDRQIALEYLAEAWQSAELDGIEGEALAHAALFAALATLVRTFGEEATADMVARLPERIRAAEYSIDRSIQ